MIALTTSVPRVIAAVDHDLGAPADRLDHLGQHVDRADPLVELAPAMVRHIDAIDPVIDRDLGVLGGGDALEDDWGSCELRLIRSMSRQLNRAW